MSQIWGPTAPGKLFTQATDWKLTLAAEQFLLQAGSQTVNGGVREIERLYVVPGRFWATVSLPLPDGPTLRLDGIPNASAQEMAAAIAKSVRRLRVADYLRNFSQALQPVTAWADQARQACKTQLNAKGWLTDEFKAGVIQQKPSELAELLAEPEVMHHLESQAQAVKDAVGLWQQDFNAVADRINERHLAAEYQAGKAFFNQVEKSPLTDEQAKAVICFDNRVLLVASAGSGKTSTMVAKAGYALDKGYFAAEKMLLLAFNNDAAAELRERLKARLTPLGLPADKIEAKTFHAFGLDVIGLATGKRPSLAPWLENGRDLTALLEMVDDLKDRDAMFRTRWDLFRIVLGQDLPTFGKESASPEAWDSATQTDGFWTLNGEVVKSRGEQLIANWLFYNGVRYAYEAPYKIETADAAHRQYHPDFYLADIDAYLEHWAVDENGDPPAEFVGYREGMLWKQQLHAEHGTTFLETTMAGLWSGEALRYLAEQLTQRGIVLDPNPERPVVGRQPIENPRLARTFRSFLTHAKSNRLTVAELRRRLEAGVAGRFRFRHHIFLGLFEQIWAAWESRLQREHCIDFDDMLGLAATCIEEGQWTSPFELIMVDEFQDVSQARMRLIASLLKGSGKCLFAVGDDWQSINRFAGSDLAVMTDFAATFGRTVTLKLENTYRCPQSLCDISSTFVQKNPKQIRKKVRSAKPDIAQPVRILQVDDEAQIRRAVAQRINEIATAASGQGKRVRILVLGRYNQEKDYLPLEYDTSWVSVEFLTVHASKGLEADHVILPRMTAETLGFPSRIADDPVLQLAMPGGDSFEHAEERRLFYVALTRATSTVTLITVAHKVSPFIAELVNEHPIAVYDLEGVEISSEVCPACKEGFLVKRKGKYGHFYGCSRFPRCKHTRKIHLTHRNDSGYPVKETLLKARG